MKTRGDLLALIKELAGRPGGATNADVAKAAGIPSRVACSRCYTAASRGQIFAEPGSKPARWHLSAAVATKGKPSKPANVTLKGKPSDMRGQADYSRAKWTRDTTDRPTAAYQALDLPADPRYPSFAGRIGFYDEVTA